MQKSTRLIFRNLKCERVGDEEMILNIYNSSISKRNSMEFFIKVLSKVIMLSVEEGVRYVLIKEKIIVVWKCLLLDTKRMEFLRHKRSTGFSHIQG